jgi:hypothetical protein
LCPFSAKNTVGGKNLPQSFGLVAVQADHGGIRVEEFSEHGFGPFQETTLHSFMR